MATTIWRGDAQVTVQVSTITFSGWTSGDIFTVTINGKDIAYTTVDTTAATVVDAFVSLIGQYGANETYSTTYNGATLPAEFAEIEAVNVGNVLYLYGPTDGTPFTVTCTDDGAGSGTVATPTAASGPNHWDNAENWSGGAVPVNSDDVYFENSNVDCLHGLAQSAVTLTSLHVRSSYTGKIGLPNYNDNGYYEYRATELAVNSTNVYIGEGEGGGSSRIKLTVGSAQTNARVYRTAAAEDSDIGAFVLRGTHISNALRVERGDVGFGMNKAGDAGALAALEVAYVDSKDSDATVRIGAGVTQNTLTEQTGGDLTLHAAVTTLRAWGGTSRIEGAATVGTLDLMVDSECEYNSTGTLTQGYVAGDSVLSFGRTQSRTVTNCSIYSGATLVDEGETVTWSNAIALVRCRPADVTLTLAPDITILPG